jgi:hypothetical protein
MQAGAMALLRPLLLDSVPRWVPGACAASRSRGVMTWHAAGGGWPKPRADAGAQHPAVRGGGAGAAGQLQRRPCGGHRAERDPAAAGERGRSRPCCLAAWPVVGQAGRWHRAGGAPSAYPCRTDHPAATPLHPAADFALPHAQVYSLAEQNRFYKKAAAGCLRAVAKHSPQLAQAVIDSGSLDALVTCLEEFDPGGRRAGELAAGLLLARPGVTPWCPAASCTSPSLRGASAPLLASGRQPGTMAMAAVAPPAANMLGQPPAACRAIVLGRVTAAAGHRSAGEAGAVCRGPWGSVVVDWL